MPAADLETVIAECAERGVLVISDETYERFVYDTDGFVSAAAFAARYPQTVAVVGSFSKTYAMTGWRIGFVLGPRQLTSGVAAIQSHATSNPTSFAMVGAREALASAEEDVQRMIAEFGQRRDLIVERLNRIPGVSCPTPAGAFYVFPNVSAYFLPGEGSIELTEFLLEQVAVAVVPGIAFGHDAHIRFSFTSPRSLLEEGLDRVAEALARRGTESQESSCAV